MKQDLKINEIINKINTLSKNNKISIEIIADRKIYCENVDYVEIDNKNRFHIHYYNINNDCCGSVCEINKIKKIRSILL